MDQVKELESYKYIQGKGINSLLAVPILKDSEVTGFVSVDNPKKYYDDTTLLSSIQFFILNSLSTKEYQQELQFMSYFDELTSLYNRNKYNQILSAYQNQLINKIGVCYLDLNGLKKINDKNGHEVGDNYIRISAQIINTIFPQNTYRIGGDEFVVIVFDINQSTFEKKIQLLRKQIQNQQVSISIGALWKNKYQNLNELLIEADQCMYKEKKIYHQNQS